jgi:hypothetical protein
MNNLFLILTGITLTLSGIAIIGYSVYDNYTSTLLSKPTDKALAESFRDL